MSNEEAQECYNETVPMKDGRQVVQERENERLKNFDLSKTDAYRITALEAEVKRLREALDKCKHVAEMYGSKAVIRQIRNAAKAMEQS